MTATVLFLNIPLYSSYRHEDVSLMVNLSDLTNIKKSGNSLKIAS